MRPIEPLILSDPSGKPVAVQLKYADWLDIQRNLGDRPAQAARHPNDFAGKLRKLGDGVEFQRRARDEWR